MPVLTYLNPLDKETLVRILQEPKNALIKQYKKLFALENIKLTFTKDSLEYIAEKAMDYKLGARGLRSILEAILTDSMFELPSETDITEFVVDKSYAHDKLMSSAITKLKAA